VLAQTAMARRWSSRSYGDSWGWYPRQATVRERVSAAAKEEEKLRKKGEALHPVRIQGRTIARSFWGKAWCSNLERYSDYSNRLPRGRSYLSSGQVLDLRIEPGRVIASVMGTRLYRVSVTIDPISTALWQEIVRDCTGRVASMVDLLRGQLSHEVMDRVTLPKEGLFPSPAEIHLSCSCPDWATMCKHVAATLYGVGARLDQAPELLFVLRGVSAADMVVDTHAAATITRKARSKALTQDTDELSALFGIEMAGAPVSSSPPGAVRPEAKRGIESPARRPSKAAATKSAKPAKPAAAKAAKPAKPAATKSAKPAATRSAKPAATKPVKPAATKAAKPAATKPVKPAATKPVKPAATKSAKAVATNPTKAVATKPTKAVATKSAKAVATKSAKPAATKSTKASAAKPVDKPLVTQEQLQASGITSTIVANWESEGYLVRGRRDGTWHATPEALYRMENFLPKKKRARR
jgi:uncharacterized Zn finger protein